MMRPFKHAIIIVVRLLLSPVVTPPNSLGRAAPPSFFSWPSALKTSTQQR